MSLVPEESQDRLLAGCEAIGKAASAASAPMWEVFAIQSYGQDVEIERGRVSLAGGGGDGGYCIRVVDSGRTGFAYSTTSDNAAEMVREAMRVCALTPAVEGLELPADSGSTSVDGMWDSKIDEITPEELMEQADLVISKVSDLDSRAVVTGGGMALSCHVGALLTSQGITSSGKISSHSTGIQVSIDEDDRITSGWSSMSSRSLISDFDGMCEEGVEWAISTRDLVEVEQVAEEAPVLFTHRGISGLFSNIFCSALRGEKLARGESVWSGKFDQQILESHLSLVDDGRLPGGSGSGTRDGEGLPTRTTSLIESGRLISGIWSTRDAAEQVEAGNVESAISTANAGRGGHHSPPVTSFNNLILDSSKSQSKRASMIEEMDEGFLVQSVMGAHTANPSSGDFSVTSSSILRVKDGEIIGALKQAGLSGNLPSAFSRDVSLAKMSQANPLWSGGSVIVPDVLLNQGIRVNSA